MLAILDDNHVCVGFCGGVEDESSGNYVYIGDYTEDHMKYIGMTYLNDEWTGDPFVEQEPMISDQEIQMGIQSEILLNQMDILESQELQEEILSQILLNQMEV